MRVNNFLGGISLIFFSISLAACTEVSSPNQASSELTPSIYINSYQDVNQVECLSGSTVPTSSPEEDSIFPKVDQTDHKRGSLNPIVTIIEYSDFQCPGCVALSQELRKLDDKYPTELQVVFRQLPLYDIHDKAFIAAQATELAGDENKFWDLHDLLYDNFGTWVSMSPENYSIWLVDQVASIGLDPSFFKINLGNKLIIERVQSKLEEGLSIGLRSTPFLLINGEIYYGPTDYKNLAQIIELVKLGKRQFTNCPEMLIDPLKQYIATLQTEKGDIIVQLFADKAPFTVNSFVFLSRNGWYDDNTFFKVINGFAFTGDPSGTGLGGPGFFYGNELDNSINFDQPGVVAMMNSGLENNGSQFFITTTSQPELNGSYTIFGQVISGLDVLFELTPRDPETDKDPLPGDLLIKVTISEN